jgi:tRNA (cmo5U34)-methyltransferase
MAQFHDAPARYMKLMRDALPLYDRLQDELVKAGADLTVSRFLDLGTGTRETARRCLEAHPTAAVVAVDASEDTLDVGTAVLGEDAEWRLGHLEDELPDGPFELVISALAVHHLDRAGKADLFASHPGLLGARWAKRDGRRRGARRAGVPTDAAGPDRGPARPVAGP